MRKKQKPFIFLAIGLGAFILLLPLFFYLRSLIVQTDRWRLKKQLHQTARAVMHRNYLTLKQIMSADYDGSIGSSPEEAISIARNVLEHVEDLRVKILSTDITVDENKKAHLHCEFEYSGYYVGSEIYDKIPLSGGLPAAVPGEVWLRFRKESEIWRISHADLVLGEQSQR